jgi:hypothetical protein
MASLQIWSYRDTTFTQQNLTGLSAEALDGSIGKVDDASNDVEGSFTVVDTGLDLRKEGVGSGRCDRPRRS